MENHRQRVLVCDIETSPITAYIWSLKEQYVQQNQIAHDWYVMAWAAKWLGDPASSVIYHDLRNTRPPDNDKELVTKLWKLLNEADIVITQNGKNFDSPKLNARFIEHGLKPPSPYTHLDTYQMLNRTAGFTSHSLEYLTAKLCTKYKKLSHKKFPGLSLWVECLKGNKEAWDEMKAYNIHDVLSTEELYLKIRPWTNQTAPKVFISDKEKSCCSVCGGKQRSLGVRYNLKTPYRRLLCLKCGHWDRGVVEKEKKHV